MHFRQPFHYGIFNTHHLFGQIHLLSIDISNVKYVDNLVRFGCNFRNPEIQIAAIQRIGHAEKQTWKIIGEYFDDGKKTGTRIVNRHLMGFFTECGFGVTVNAHFLTKSCSEVQFLGQRSPKVGGGAVPFFVLQYRIRWRGDLKNIQSDFVAPGKDLDIQNIDVVQRKDTGNF